jgi:hypothetical protein
MTRPTAGDPAQRKERGVGPTVSKAKKPGKSALPGSPPRGTDWRTYERPDLHRAGVHHLEEGEP